jgi:TetR/AcrR family transcriptional repressor of nem operon
MDTTPDTRQRLINSAQELIYASSYSDVGVQQICDQAGVRKGSFYHFFPSKRDLTLAVLDQMQTFFRDTIISSAFASDIPPLQRIDRFFKQSYTFHKQMKQASGHVPGCPFGNLGSEMSTQDEVIRTRVEAIFSNLEKHFESVLSDAVASGELPEIDIAATAQAIFAYVEGIMVIAKTRNDPELIRELGQRALQLAVPANMQ